MTETVLHDDTDMTIVEVTSNGWPDTAGSSRSVRIDWKNGGPPGGGTQLDIAALADQLAAVSETVDFLILSAAGDL